MPSTSISHPTLEFTNLLVTGRKGKITLEQGKLSERYLHVFNQTFNESQVVEYPTIFIYYKRSVPSWLYTDETETSGASKHPKIDP